MLYKHSTSLLHAKTALVDKVWSTVGSINMDFRSMKISGEKVVRDVGSEEAS